MPRLLVATNGHRRAPRKTVLASATIAVVIAWVLGSSGAVRAASPPAALQFLTPNVTVAAGSSVDLVWRPPGPGEYFILTSGAPYALPNFGTTAITWPAGSNHAYQSAWGWWTTTANEIHVAIPSGVAVGTTYRLQLYTCTLSACSNSPGATGPAYSEASLGVGQRALQFTTPSVTALSGTQVGLHWPAPKPGEFFFLTSAAPNTLPNFGSTGISWPSGSNATYNATWGWWVTTSNAARVTMPAGTPAGTSYALQLLTCNLSTGLCSDAPGSPNPTNSVVTLPAVTNWTSLPYTGSFSGLNTAATGGAPLDVTIDSADNIWGSSEFNNALLKVSSANSPSTLPVTDTASSSTPFPQCLFYFTNGCGPTNLSEIGERVIVANGLIWSTQGGWFLPSASTTPLSNLSRIVAVDPTTGGMCTYDVPGTDNEVIGITSTGTGSQTVIWFVETGGTGGPGNANEFPAYLDSFQPSQLGSGCSVNVSYSQSAVGSVLTRHALPNTFPAHIAVDPASNAMWISDVLHAIKRIDLGSFSITNYNLTSSSSSPWQIAVDAGYVYMADYGARNLVRLNKATGAIDYVAVPVYSDTEQPHSLTLANGALYFTLSDDAFILGGYSYFPASTLGYIDIAAWEAASAQCANGSDCVPMPTLGQAVVYTGLDGAADPTGAADFRGIAVGSQGDVGIADGNQIVRLVP